MHHRCMVMDVLGSIAKVCLIDYGDCAIVGKDDFFRLTPALTNHPTACRYCTQTATIFFKIKKMNSSSFLIGKVYRFILCNSAHNVVWFSAHAKRATSVKYTSVYIACTYAMA